MKAPSLRIIFLLVFSLGSLRSMAQVPAMDLGSYGDLKKLYSDRVSRSLDSSRTDLPDLYTNDFYPLIIHDVRNVIEPKYRTYGTYKSLFCAGKLYLKDPATYLSLKFYAEKVIERLMPYLNENSRPNVDQALNLFKNDIDKKLASYPAADVLEAADIAQTVIGQFFNVYRKNDLGMVGFWNVGDLPGQFRVEPNTGQDQESSFISYVGAKPFSICDSKKIIKDFPQAPLLFDQVNLNSTEEVRCLGRRLDSQGQIVDQVSCSPKQTVDTLDAHEVGYKFGLTRQEILKQMQISRQWTLDDNIFLDALVSMVSTDAQVLRAEIAFNVNNWRPVTAIRHGLGPSGGIIVDPQWEPMDGFVNFPDYPSGSVSQISAYMTLTEKVLMMDSRFKNNPNDLTVIDGRPVSIVQSASYSYLGQQRNPSIQIKSIDQVIDLWAFSRIAGGAHFRYSTDAGKLLGKKIGNNVWSNGLLAPLGSAIDPGHSVVDEFGNFNQCL